MNLKLVSLLLLMNLSFCLAQELAVESQSQPGVINIRYQIPFVTLQSRLQDSNGNQAIDAEEQAILVVLATNSGPGKAYNLQFHLSTTTPATFLTIPRMTANLDLLQAGETKTVEFPIAAGFATPNDRVAFRIVVSEKFDTQITPLDITFETRAFSAPDLILADWGINDTNGTYTYGNSNNKIEKGETIEVKALVQNRGKGEARQVMARVEFDEDKLFFIGKREFALGDLSSGGFRDISFQVTVPMNYNGPAQLPINLRLSESRGQYDISVPLNLALNETTRVALNLRSNQSADTGSARIALPSSLSVDIDTNIPAGVKKRPDAVAVVIGNCNYQTAQVPMVEYAQNDALVMKEYLTKTLGYDSNNIIYLANATKAQLDATFGNEQDFQGRLYNLIKPNQSEVFIYYSGHGSPDPQTKQAYLVPVDADPTFIRFNGYSLAVLYQNLAKLSATDITVVIDACFSGASEAGMLIQNASPLFIDVKTPALQVKQAMVFASSNGGQISSWYPEKKHGLFTYFFLKGLSGAADLDQDKKVTVKELNSFINDQVPPLARRLHNREQTPMLLPGLDILGTRATDVIVQF
jgi:hypothetical protein